MISQLLSVIAGFVLGLIFGSFFAALIMRWPEGKSVLSGRSACDRCGRSLGARELVPLASALVQRGQCRTCGAPIDPLHWQMELSCALVGAGAAWLAPVPQAWGWMVLGWLLLTLSVLDARHYWLPDALTLMLAGLGLTIGPLVTGVHFVDAAVGAAAGYGALLIVALAYKQLRGREGLGMGDAKLLGALGAWFGWQALPFILLLAALLGLGWALTAAIRSGVRLNGLTMIPLGTFLSIAAIPAGLLAKVLIY